VDVHNPVALMENCVFCKIGAGEIPATVIERGDGVIAIADLNPQAPSHVLVMPLAHHATIAELVENDPATAGSLLATAAAIGRKTGAQRGFRLVINSGDDGGQTVDHVHVHVLAGRPMSWPPG
jgi:histidine triad (HIT) family protein